MSFKRAIHAYELTHIESKKDGEVFDVKINGIDCQAIYSKGQVIYNEKQGERILKLSNHPQVVEAISQTLIEKIEQYLMKGNLQYLKNLEYQNQIDFNESLFDICLNAFFVTYVNSLEENGVRVSCINNDYKLEKPNEEPVYYVGRKSLISFESEERFYNFLEKLILKIGYKFWSGSFKEKNHGIYAGNDTLKFFVGMGDTKREAINDMLKSNNPEALGEHDKQTFTKIITKLLKSNSHDFINLKYLED